MNDRRRLGQAIARLVMVGDNQFDAEFPRQGRFGRASDAAIDGHEQLVLSAARLRTASLLSP